MGILPELPWLVSREPLFHGNPFHGNRFFHGNHCSREHSSREPLFPPTSQIFLIFLFVIFPVVYYLTNFNPKDALSASHYPPKLLFFEDFDHIDPKRWKIERQIDSNGNGEFQAYTSDPNVIFTRDSKLVIKPKLMDADCFLELMGWDKRMGCEYNNAK